jgi:hypothetical protein
MRRITRSPRCGLPPSHWAKQPLSSASGVRSCPQLHQAVAGHDVHGHSLLAPRAAKLKLHLRWSLRERCARRLHTRGGSGHGIACFSVAIFGWEDRRDEDRTRAHQRPLTRCSCVQQAAAMSASALCDASNHALLIRAANGFVLQHWRAWSCCMRASASGVATATDRARSLLCGPRRSALPRTVDPIASVSLHDCGRPTGWLHGYTAILRPLRHAAESKHTQAGMPMRTMR